MESSMRNSSYFLPLTAVAMLLVVGCKQDPKSDVQKVSYAIGQQIGQNIKQQGIDVDAKMVAQSVEEAITGKDSRMTKEDMQAAMMNLQKTMMEKRTKKMAEMKEEAKKNVGIGQKFLDENKAKDGIKVTKSGLQYRVLKKGTGKKPKSKSKVKVHYKGTLIDGSEFDSSYKRNKPAEFPVNGVIKGWQEALTLMKEGGKWELFIPSGLAYGEQGRPKIPPNSVLVFEVELLEILKK